MQLKKIKDADDSSEHIAYFSMEIGISHKLPTYAGGLGVLAGDTLKSFADLQMPVIAFTLFNRKGYFYQKISPTFDQSELETKWRPEDFFEKMNKTVSVQINDRTVELCAWKHNINGCSGFKLPVFFLDSNIEKNSKYDRSLTDYLYGGDRYYRLCQEIILGVGGVRMLNALGYTNIRKYHMNEGHAALLTIELLREESKKKNSDTHNSLEAVRQKCVFTTHTPVAAGHDKFDINIFRQVLGNYVPEFIIDGALQSNQVNMTLIGLNSSKYINGVAKSHGWVTRKMFPEYAIDSITNGIHPASWASASFSKLFDECIPGWVVDPYNLRNVLNISDNKIWDAHYAQKNALIDYINVQENADFHPGRFTIGYARRFTAYKRPDLILWDVNWLESLAERVGDIQLVFAGKAHPSDYAGKDLIKKVISIAGTINSHNSKLKIVFLKNYDMQLAKMMVSGCDIWLNTPKQPREASGTSGMKAALNAVPQFSTLDGWWVEGNIEGITGWSIGKPPIGENHDGGTTDEQDATCIYEKLENDIIPTFYSNREKWISIMKHCIAINASFFNTHRMAQQYITNAYMK